MDKDYDVNLSEENNYSIMSNDELQDINSFTDYSTSLAASSSLASPNNMNHQNNSQYSNYTNMNLQPDMTGMFASQGSSSANLYDSVTFRNYLDQLFYHLHKHDPESMKYVEDLIKRKTGEMDSNEAGRTTPLLFPVMHALAKLNFPGLIYQLIPNSLSQIGGFIRISDEIYPKHHEFLNDDYPGPLTIEKTTEEQIFYYLKDQMTAELQDTAPIDWDSGQLLVNYLELLIKENGKPRISNVVRLLNEGIETKTSELRKEYKAHDSISRNSFSRASSRAASRSSSRAPSPENRELIADPNLPQNTLDTPQGPGSVTSIMRRAVNTVSQDQKMYQNMDKYRDYIFSGRFEEAVKFAMRADIWDHAFALALRMNNTALVNEILLKFSRHAIYGNDPLFTMHELMSGKPPRIVATNRGFSNSEMGDWRSHLSMILAVKKFRPEESRQAIESMGEKLMMLRSYFAAHLCFLLAGTSFGIDKSAHKYRRKFDLIGWQSSTSNIPAQKSSYQFCHKLFSGLDYWRSAPEQYVKLTEVYEYVLRLRGDNSHRSLSVHLIPYKYLMAYRMLADQQTKTAYEYCKNIGEILGYEGNNWLKCESVTFHIVANIRDLSYKLHSLQHNFDDEVQELDCKWLNNIDEVYCLFCQKYNFWNPKAQKLDLEQIFNSVDDDEADSLSDSCSQVRRVYPESNVVGNSYVDSESNVMYSHQPPEDISHQFSRLPGHENVMDHKYLSQQNPRNNAPSNHNQSQPVQLNNPQRYEQPRNPGADKSNGPTFNSVNQPGQMKYPFGGNNFTQIPPPSELPTEMIMTSPPRRSDMRTASSTNVVGDNVQYRNRVPNNFNDSYNSNLNMPPQTRQPTLNNNTHVPAVQQQTIEYNYGATNGANTMEEQYQPQMNRANQFPTNVFMPSTTYQESRGSNETVDCFTTMPAGYSRSRSQSNGSIGSADSQLKSGQRLSLSRSRNNSESKETNNKLTVGGHLSNRPLESTKEEIESKPVKPKEDTTSSSGEKNRGWKILNYFSSTKPKEVHLGDNSGQSLEYDSAQRRWIDRSNPEPDEAPVLPPIMPITASQMPAAHHGASFNSPVNQFNQSVTPQSTLSKYRLATSNIKPSLNIPSPVLPSFGVPPAPLMHNNVVGGQYNSSGRENTDGRPYSRDDNHQYNPSSHVNTYNSPQSAYNSQYDSNIYQSNDNLPGNK